MQKAQEFILFSKDGDDNDGDNEYDDNNDIDEYEYDNRYHSEFQKT